MYSAHLRYLTQNILNRCPSIHIVPCNDNSAYAISHKLKSMLDVSDFKGNIFSHSLRKKLVNILELFCKVLY